MLVTDPAARADDCRRLTAAVRDAGALALETFGRAPRSWTKHGDSPVSEADIAVNDLLRARLLDSAADDGWMSEESENDPSRLGKRRVWVIDPIDGTRAYIAGRPDWAISAALIEHGRPRVAALLAPASGELFVAVEGRGATCNGVPIAAKPGAGLESARLAGPRRTLEALAAQRPGLEIVPRIHSLALRLVRVAHGDLDAAIAGGNSHDWDLAAADLLLHEAGAVLTSLGGEPLTYNRPDPVHGLLVAAGRERHSTVVEMIRAHLASSV